MVSRVGFWLVVIGVVWLALQFGRPSDTITVSVLVGVAVEVIGCSLMLLEKGSPRP